jgi:hypothetical protein
VVPSGELRVVVALVVHVPAEHDVAEAEAALDRGEELVPRWLYLPRRLPFANVLRTGDL